MKQINREKMLRAIGILEGVSYTVSDAAGVALERVGALMEEVLTDEEYSDGRKEGNRRDL